MRTLALLALFILGGCACDTPAERPEPDFASLTGPAAQVRFKGEVLERLPSDNIWCGVVATFQGVRYRVVKQSEGPPLPKEVTVHHLLVGPPHCEPDEPVLRRDLFAVGRHLDLVADLHPSGDLVGHETEGHVVSSR